MQDTDQAYRYSIQPYLDSSQIKPIHLLSPGKNILPSYFLKENNYLQFQDKQDKSVLFFDKRLFAIQFPQKLTTDYFYISSSKTLNADFDFLNKNYNYSIDNRQLQFELSD